MLGPVRRKALQQAGLSAGELPLQLRGPLRGCLPGGHQPVRPADAEAAGHVAAVRAVIVPVPVREACSATGPRTGIGAIRWRSDVDDSFGGLQCLFIVIL